MKILALLLSLALSTITLAASPVDNLQIGLDLKIGEIKHSITTLQSRYGEELDKLAASLQAKGDLDQLLLVKQEKDTYLTGAEVKPDAYDKSPKLKALRWTYADTLKRLQREAEPKVRAVYQTYGKHLEKLKSELTQQGKIEDAVLVAAEMERVQELLAASAPVAGLPKTVEEKNEWRNLVGKSVYFPHQRVAGVEVWVEFRENGDASWVGINQSRNDEWKYEETEPGNFAFWDPKVMSLKSAHRVKLERDGKTGLATVEGKELPAQVKRTR